MTTKTKNALMILVPMVAAGAVIFLLNRKKKSPLVAGTEEDIKDAPVSSLGAASTAASSVFPLKQGSKGDKVKELQRTIGATPDGVFGPNTENALISYAGVRVVQNQKELDSLKNKAIGISNSVRADDLVKKFKSSNLSMYVIKDATTEIVSVDAYGAVQHSGNFKIFPGGKTYSRADYVLVGSTKLGNLLFTINKGALAGTYSVDPNLISLK